MPNMFGGPQDHPAYDCITKLAHNQAMHGNTLYTLVRPGIVEALEVNGQVRTMRLDSTPKNVQKKLTKVQP